MIRQAISCDICGTDMQQTNQWFVVYLQGSELRISRWNSQGRPRAGAKHLCGQTCLHKLVDEVMAQTLTGRGTSPAAEEMAMEQRVPAGSTLRTDASLTSPVAYAAPSRSVPRILETRIDELEPDEFESSARLIPTPKATPLVFESRSDPYEADEFESSARLITTPKPEAVPTADAESEPPVYNSRSLRAEAWKREREREKRAARHAGAPHRRSVA